jgi:hypothetical protein
MPKELQPGAGEKYGLENNPFERRAVSEFTGVCRSELGLSELQKREGEQEDARQYEARR